MVQQDPMYDPAALNLHSREAQHTNAGENRASKGTIRDAVRAVIEGFETDPTATMSLPLHRNLQAYHSQLIALGRLNLLSLILFGASAEAAKTSLYHNFQLLCSQSAPKAAQRYMLNNDGQ